MGASNIVEDNNGISIYIHVRHDTLLHMLNPFPIQFLALFAYTILRVIVGVVLLNLGMRHASVVYSFQKNDALNKSSMNTPFILFIAISEVILGSLYIIGLYTQYVALGTVILSIILLLYRNHVPLMSMVPKSYYALLIGISLSLFITNCTQKLHKLQITGGI